MAIALPPDLQDFVQQELATGEYRSIEDVMSEALRLLRWKRRHDALRGKIQAAVEQVERGEVKPLDMQAIKDEVRRRCAERGQHI